MAQELAGSSDHHGGAEEVTALCQTAPQEQPATPPTLMKRILHGVIIVIAIGFLIVSYVLLRAVLPPKMVQKIVPIEQKIPKILRAIPK
jgi:hypothetical protein